MPKCTHLCHRKFVGFYFALDIMITSPCNKYPLTHPPLLYSKSEVYRGIHYFLIFALKHRLWVLVPTINVLSKNKKKIIIFHLKIKFFTAVKNYSILHGRVFVMDGQQTINDQEVDSIIIKVLSSNN